MKKDSSWKFILVLFAIFLPIRLFIAEPFLVYGSSMAPNFDTGDYIIVDELTYKIKSPVRGDVIVLKPPYDDSKHLIKRIVGLPGETVEVNATRVTIYNTNNPNGFLLTEPYVDPAFQSSRTARYSLGPYEYFVMGDNRTVSYDSRSWGPLPQQNIKGRAFLRLYPFHSMSILPASLEDFTNK